MATFATQIVYPVGRESITQSKGVSWQSTLTRFINLLTAVVHMNLELLAAFVDHHQIGVAAAGQGQGHTGNVRVRVVGHMAAHDSGQQW